MFDSVDRTTLLYATATTTAVCVMAGALWREYTSHSRADNGVPVASWSWSRSMNFGGDGQHVFDVKEQIDQHGPLIRIPLPPGQPRAYILAHPEYAREFLETEHNKPQGSMGGGLSRKNIVSRDTVNDGWHETRKPVTKAFSQRNLQAVVDTYKVKCRMAYKLMDNYSSNNREFCLKKLLFRISVDTILESMMLFPSSACIEPEGVEFEDMCFANKFIHAQEVYARVTFSRIMYTMPWQKAKRKELDAQKKHFHKYRKATSDTIVEHFFEHHHGKTETERSLVSLVCTNPFYKGDREGMSSDIRTFLVGGFDVGAQASAFLLYHLIKNPDILAKCQDEIDSVMGERETANITDVFPYLEMCIKESIRLTPVSARGVWRHTVKDFKVDDKVIPKGSIVNTSIYSLYNGKHVQDRDTFMPERFEKGAPQYELMNELSKLTFSAGKRQCVGLRKGMIDIRMVSANMIRNFEFELKGEPNLSTWLILGMDKMPVTCRRRERPVAREADFGA